MEFEWDDEKNRANLAKHGIDFATASRIFDGLVFSRPDSRREYGEDRLVSIGRLRESAIVVVAHTDRSGRRRLISARPASRKERRRYDEEVQRSARRA